MGTLLLHEPTPPLTVFLFSNLLTPSPFSECFEPCRDTCEKGKEKIINQAVTSGILIRDLSGYDSLILAFAANIIALLPTQFRALIRVETLVTWAGLIPHPLSWMAVMIEAWVLDSFNFK